MIIGFAKSFAPNSDANLFPIYLNSLIGGIMGYLVIWLIILSYKKFKNKEGMGLGDAKLLSAIGFWFGWICIPFIIFISSVVALLVVTPEGVASRIRTSILPNTSRGRCLKDSNIDVLRHI